MSSGARLYVGVFCASAALAAVTWLLWSRMDLISEALTSTKIADASQNPLERSRFDPDAADLLDLEWDSREPSASLLDSETVLDELREFPLEGRHHVADGAHDELLGMLTDLYVSAASNDPTRYFRRLEMSGETVKASVLKTVTEVMGDQNNRDRSPWDVLVVFHRQENWRSRWDRLVPDGSGIKYYVLTEAPISAPADDLAKRRGAITTYNRVSEPPVSLEQLLAKRRSIVMAEVTLFVRHDEASGAIVRPYIGRFWLNSTTGKWHPYQLVALQNPGEHFPIGILF